MSVAERKKPLMLIVALAASTCAILAVGCSRGPKITFVADGGTYTAAQARQKTSAVDPGPASSVNAEDAPSQRTAALIALRGNGPEASAAADLLTRDFPQGVRAVPYYVEAATVDGAEAWVVAETWGSRSGKLDKKRLWILERGTGRVLFSATLQ